ncbi:MAG: OadG family protein, partial [Sporomusa sp.]
TNPLMISFINMTVVFAVLYALSWVIKFIQIIDPTQKKNVTKNEAAPAGAPAATPEPTASYQNEDEVVVLIAAAIAAYGFSASQIVSIRPIGGGAWSQAARLDAVNARTQLF